jgi:PAS domain S-box-containing protein
MAFTTPSLIEEILDATSTGWWEHNALENKITINSSWLKILGLKENGQAIGMKQWLRMIHPDDRTPVFKSLNDFIHQDGFFRIEWRMLNAEGVFVWFTSRMKVMERTEGGKPLRTVGMVTLNIQEHARIEFLEKEAIKKAQLINGLMQISFSSTSVYDFVNQKVISSQWRIMKKLGYEMEETADISNHFFQKITHPDDIPVIERHIEKMKKSKKDEVVECLFRLKAKNGRYHWIVLRDTVLGRTNNGDLCQLLGTMVDVSRYKEIKEELEQNLAMLDSLSYRNSHELRAPVATILGLINVIRHELETEGSVQELIDLLEQTISKMDHVIHEFNNALSG